MAVPLPAASTLHIVQSVRLRTDGPSCRLHGAVMDTRLHPDIIDDVESAPDLAAWDAEGGALAVPAQTSANAPAALSGAERRLLGRLGAALVGEWNSLPMPLRRAIYDRAVRGAATCDPSALKRRMARFLHDRKGSGQPSIRS